MRPRRTPCGARAAPGPHPRGGAPPPPRAAAAAPPAPRPPAPLPDVIAPEDFELAPGVLGPVDRETPASPADAYRCVGCTAPECMVRGGVESDGARSGRAGSGGGGRASDGAPPFSLGSPQSPTGCAKSQWRFTPSGYLRKILTARVYDVAIETPLQAAPRVSERVAAAAGAAAGPTLFLKREDLQPVFSFKLRGAYNRMSRLSDEERARGVIASSAGNHAQGVALAASRLGCAATICMPVSTPAIKVDAVRRLGGAVELVGGSYTEAQAAACERAAARGLTFIAPYDDPYTVAGQGTIGAEILRQLDSGSLENLAAIFVAVGGGGLAAGVAAYVKALRPDVAVIGVEPTGANAMAASLAAGRRVGLSRVDAFADGVAVKSVGAETFRLCRAHLDGVLLVSPAAISAAIKDVFNETRCILEPAGAVAVAGAKAWAAARGPATLAGRAIVAVTSGANMNFDTLRLVAELADVGGAAEATLATSLPEARGAFLAFVAAAVDGAAIQITELKYRAGGPASALASVDGGGGGGDGAAAAPAVAHVLWGAAAPDAAAAAALVPRLDAAGFPTIDLSAVDAAQVHLRHLVGGRGGGLPHERILLVDFPERPRALLAFLTALSPRWNVSLFHYRASGGPTTSALIGVQVPPGDEADFAAATASLGPDFAFAPLRDEARAAFDMFVS